MKKIILSILSIFVFLVSFSQSEKINFVCYYGHESNPDLACMNMQRSFTSTIDAENAVKKILKPLGITPNFVMVSCYNINNCAAMTLSDGFRYIVYDKEFMQQISQTSGSQWTNLSILAHEISHHLEGHTLLGGTNEQRRQMELAADKFSGFILQKLGATESEALIAMNTVKHPECDDEAYYDHPCKMKRIEAIKKGYREAKELAGTSIKTSPSSGFNMNNNDIVRSPIKPVLKDSWNEGFNCRKICFGQGKYYSFMVKGFGDWQQYNTSVDFPREKIIETWKRSPGTIITNLDYFNGNWNLVMTEIGSNTINQKYVRDNSFPKSKIISLWEEKYYITDVSYGQGEYVVVMTTPENYAFFTEQMYNFSSTFPDKKIKEYWNKNYYITVLEFINGEWFLVMSQYRDRNEDNFNQKWFTDINFPMNKIIEADLEGYSFVSVSYGNGKWSVVMNKRK